MPNYLNAKFFTHEWEWETALNKLSEIESGFGEDVLLEVPIALSGDDQSPIVRLIDTLNQSGWRLQNPVDQILSLGPDALRPALCYARLTGARHVHIEHPDAGCWQSWSDENPGSKLIVLDTRAATRFGLVDLQTDLHAHVDLVGYCLGSNARMLWAQVIKALFEPVKSSSRSQLIDFIGSLEFDISDGGFHAYSGLRLSHDVVRERLTDHSDNLIIFCHGNGYDFMFGQSAACAFDDTPSASVHALDFDCTHLGECVRKGVTRLPISKIAAHHFLLCTCWGVMDFPGGYSLENTALKTLTESPNIWHTITTAELWVSQTDAWLAVLHAFLESRTIGEVEKKVNQVVETSMFFLLGNPNSVVRLPELQSVLAAFGQDRAPGIVRAGFGLEELTPPGPDALRASSLLITEEDQLVSAHVAAAPITGTETLKTAATSNMVLLPLDNDRQETEWIDCVLEFARRSASLERFLCCIGEMADDHKAEIASLIYEISVLRQASAYLATEQGRMGVGHRVLTRNQAVEALKLLDAWASTQRRAASIIYDWSTPGQRPRFPFDIWRPLARQSSAKMGEPCLSCEAGFRSLRYDQQELQTGERIVHLCRVCGMSSDIPVGVEDIQWQGFEGHYADGETTLRTRISNNGLQTCRGFLRPYLMRSAQSWRSACLQPEEIILEAGSSLVITNRIHGPELPISGTYWVGYTGILDGDVFFRGVKILGQQDLGVQGKFSLIKETYPTVSRKK